MSMHSIREQVADLDALGFTWAMLEAEVPHLAMVADGPGQAPYPQALGLRAVGAVDRVLDRERARKAPAATPRSHDLATDRQVSYIMSLLAQRASSGEGGGFFAGPTDEAGVRSMSRAQASAYITSLTGRY